MTGPQDETRDATADLDAKDDADKVVGGRAADPDEGGE